MGPGRHCNAEYSFFSARKHAGLIKICKKDLQIYSRAFIKQPFLNKNLNKLQFEFAFFE